MTNKHIFILLFICFISFFVQGDEKDTFTISFEPLIMKGIDDNYFHLANSIPGMLYYGIKNASNHLYSEDEITFLKEKYNEDIRKEHLLKLSALIEKYNTYIFSRDYKKEEYKSLGEKIVSEQEVLDNLEYSDISDMESSLPIEFIIDEQELTDLVIKGSMEKLDEWVYLQIWIENNILGTEELLYESISSSDSIPELIPEIITKLKTVILGRVWASVVFEIVPEDSNIIITKDNEKILNQSLQYLYPGVYEIEISTQGYIAQNLTIDLKEYERKIIPVILEEEKHVIVSVQSFPSGADLYSGATWIGKTPLLMNNPIIPALLTFKLEGYNDNKIVYNDKEDRDIQIYMQLGIIDPDMFISRKRDKFYQSFSYFILSIPITMLSYGLSSDYAYAYDNEIYYSSETDRLMKLSTSWYNVYLGGLFLNLTLFVNTIFDLVDYIKSNDRL